MQGEGPEMQRLLHPACIMRLGAGIMYTVHDE